MAATPEEPLYGINLFVYCDNNPVMRADKGGDFDILLWEPFCEDRKVDLLIAVTGSLITADHINFGIEDKSDGNCYGF